MDMEVSNPGTQEDLQLKDHRTMDHGISCSEPLLIGDAAIEWQKVGKQPSTWVSLQL